MKHKYKKGQAVLFIIIILAVSLIIVSSIASRSLTGVKSTNFNTDASRAFNAAESGIDELLSNYDLGAIIGSGPRDTQSVDKTLISEAKYQADELNPGYYGKIAKDVLMQVEFTSIPPQDLKIYFDNNSCVLLSFYNTNNDVSRRVLCGTGATGMVVDSDNASEVCPASAFGTTFCRSIDSFPSGTPKMLLVKVLVNDSRIQLSASNYDVSFRTKIIDGSSWAQTKTNVRKEIQVKTKTTRDIYPVFDYALYLR